MGKEDILKFTNSIIILSKLLAKIEGRFLVEKLYGKISDMVSAFIGQCEYAAQIGLHNAESVVKPNNVRQHNMSHNVAYQNLLNSINGALDYLEYLEHDSKSDTTPLLLAQKNLLKFKLHVLKRNQVVKPERNKVEDKATNVSEIGLKPILKHKTVRSALKLDSNKEKIFNFIKKFPDARTKEIIDEFNALSDRTVKRNLKELIDEGFLKKKSEGGAMCYLITNL